jgi:pimeloyl-ACP methyl ester carboxylesterase
MSKQINHDRRRFLGTAAVTFAAGGLGLIGCARGQSGKINPANAITIKPGTNTSFASLKQINAGVLNVGYAALEKRLAQAPVINVPTITLEGDANGAPHADATAYAKKFSGKYTHRLITGGIGHNLPQEAPQAFAQAVVDVDGYSK